MSPAAALAKRKVMHASVGDIAELWADVSERLAIRDPPGEWLVERYSNAVRLYLISGEKPLSKYVWHWRDTDAQIDRLLRKAGVTDRPHPVLESGAGPK